MAHLTVRELIKLLQNPPVGFTYEQVMDMKVFIAHENEPDIYAVYDSDIDYCNVLPEETEAAEVVVCIYCCPNERQIDDGDDGDWPFLN